MILVRLVNGVADSAQRGRVASSVASLAAAAGLPRGLVDLRHEAAHNELPSLAAARAGAGEALTWLRDFYWLRQADHLAAGRAQVLVLARSYLGLHLAAAVGAAARARGEDGEDQGGTGAAARAAALALGTRCGRAEEGRGEGGHGDSDQGPAGPSPRPYSAAEGRKARRAALADLKSAVLRTCAADLVEPVWSAAAALPAGDAALGALRAALDALEAEWPGLSALLTAHLLRQLAGMPPGQAPPPRLRDWAALLCPWEGVPHGAAAARALLVQALPACCARWAREGEAEEHGARELLLDCCARLAARLSEPGDKRWAGASLAVCRGAARPRGGPKSPGARPADLDALLTSAEQLVTAQARHVQDGASDQPDVAQ